MIFFPEFCWALNFRVSTGPPETFGDGARAAILPHVFARPVVVGFAFFLRRVPAFDLGNIYRKTMENPKTLGLN